MIVLQRVRVDTLNGPSAHPDQEIPISSFADKTFTAPEQIRNFCIIAHIDHGKSTLADRMLQLTGVVDERSMRAQYLDRMDIERERGITIKAQNVRLPWRSGDEDYVLHLIDTPGHVDFTYEVSRALEACEGAVLLVDAAQGIEAQTLANLYLAMENDLEIIPVLNKIDLPAADPERYAAELAHIVGCEPDEVLRVSGKTGEGVAELLDRVIEKVPAPVGDPDAPARAMIFDSVYDTYRGVVTYVRVVDGRIVPREKIAMMSTGATHELLEVGIVSPEPKPSKGLGVGEVGYLITGVKDVRQSKVGDTVTTARGGAKEGLERRGTAVLARRQRRRQRRSLQLGRQVAPGHLVAQYCRDGAWWASGSLQRLCGGPAQRHRRSVGLIRGGSAGDVAEGGSRGER